MKGDGKPGTGEQLGFSRLRAVSRLVRKAVEGGGGLIVTLENQAAVVVKGVWTMAGSSTPRGVAVAAGRVRRSRLWR